jgi:hypothetical protein
MIAYPENHKGFQESGMRTALAGLILAGATLGLAACGGSEEGTLDAPVEAEIPELEEPVGEDTDAGEAGVMDAAKQASSGAAIPDRYHGVWDVLKSDCKDFSDERTEIAARRITYADGYGEVTAVRKDGKNTIADINLTRSGDGPPVKSSEYLSLMTTPNGIQLIITDASEPKESSEYTLKRCSG